MLPREHGAYGQLLFPLVTALAIASPRPGGWLLAAAAVFAFLAHEPMLVLLGQRGARAGREQGERAVRWFVGFATAAAASLAAAAMLVPPIARAALILPLGLGAVVGVAIVTRREHTTEGEILTAATMASLAWPVALADGVPMREAATCALVFGAAFVAATMCVRAVIMRTRRPPALAWRIAGGVAAIVAVGGLALFAATGTLADAAPWAAAPLCAGGCALAIAPPSARQLRTIGWTLVGTSAMTAAVLIAMLR